MVGAPVYIAATVVHAPVPGVTGTVLSSTPPATVATNVEE